ncbi:MAG: ATP-dependent acyl-CoA ligase [Ilumatobacteraceae bacterium]|nr:ATP-dependent acyl-CoA ligase [Ilumatobacteraceae bacterium]
MHFSEESRSLLSTMASGRTIPWLLDTRAAQRPDHPFIVWEPFHGLVETYTYARFAAEVRALAGGLRSRGVSQGDTVIVHLENCPEFLLSWFALTRIGAVPVCTNARSSVDELRYYGEHSRATAAITQPRLASQLGEALPGLKWIAVTATDAGETPSPADAPASGDSFGDLAGDAANGAPALIGSFDPAWIQYTSGTTSRPKAVVLTHANALWGAKVNAGHEALTPDDVHLIHLPLFHINALSYSMLATLWVGGTAVLVPRFSTSRFWDVAVRNGCTWAGMIPFCVRALADREVPEHRFRMWGLGAWVPSDDERFGLRTMGWYGMTETISHPVMDEHLNPGRPYAIGRAAPEYEVAVLHDDGTPVEPGETGGIFVRGVPGLSLFAEYLHDAEATRAAVDERGWLRTGDRVRLDDDGFITFADRDNDILKVGGENVAASEVERVIMGVAGVGEVAVVGGPHAMLDEVPVAFVIPLGETNALDAEILAACRAQLADFKVPREVRIVEEMPRSMLNKIAKAELRALLRS